MKLVLLQFLAKHIDCVENVTMQLKPGESLFEYFTDIHLNCKVSIQADCVEQMSRIINVELLQNLVLNPYCAINNIDIPGLKFTAKITDDWCAWNNKVFLFEQKKGKLVIKEMNGEMDDYFNLDIRGLTALVYGSLESVSELKARKWGNPSETQSRILEEMFRHKLPFYFMKF